MSYYRRTGAQQQLYVTAVPDSGRCLATSRYAFSLTVSWSTLSTYSDLYEMQCNCSHAAKSTVVFTNKTSATVNGLRASTTYGFSVTEFIGGWPVGSSECYGTTLPGSTLRTSYLRYTNLLGISKGDTLRKRQNLAFPV